MTPDDAERPDVHDRPGQDAQPPQNADAEVVAVGDPQEFDAGAPVAVDNPLGGSFEFNLLIPSVEVRMVNATALEDYEIWLFAASLSFGGVVGFQWAVALNG